MSEVGTSEILFECRKFKRNLLKHSGREPFASLLTKLASREGSASILSLSSLFPKLAVVPKDPETIINEASSGKTSELRETTEGLPFDAPKPDKINYQYIERLLIDPDVFEEISGVKTQTGTTRSILMLSKIDPNLTYFKFRHFFESLNFVPELLDLRFCFYRHRYSVIFHFSREFEAFKFFSCCERRITNFTKTFGEKYEIQFLKIREKIDQKIESQKSAQNTRKFIKKVLKPAQNEHRLRFYPEDFVAVVVRNIPENYECRDIVENLKKMKLDVELVEYAMFRDHHFCLIRLDSIEAAENACLFLHQRIIGNKMLKCHIHSCSSYERKLTEDKNFKLIFRQTSLDFQKMDEVIFNLENAGRKRDASFSESDVSRDIDHRGRTHYPQKHRYARKFSRDSEMSKGRNSPRSDSDSERKRTEFKRPYNKNYGFRNSRDSDGRFPRKDYNYDRDRGTRDHQAHRDYQDRRPDSPVRGGYNPKLEERNEYVRRPTYNKEQDYRERDSGRTKLPERSEYSRRPYMDYSKGRR